jgi:hypothetical protein
MATHRSHSISRPSKLQPKLPAQASISCISAVAPTGADAQVNSNKSLTKTLKCKQLDPDAIPIPIRAAPPVPATSSKKRARRDTLDDENGSIGHVVERPHRVRQRLISTSSVVTIRPRINVEDVGPVKGTSSAPSCVSTDSITPSEVLPRARPLSEINHSPGHTSLRGLRRVGTIEFPTMHGPESDISNQSSRIPIPVPSTFSRNSTLVAVNVGASERARSSQRPPRHARESSSSSIASLDRFDLRIVPTKVHTELWDLADECVALYQFTGDDLHTKSDREAPCTHGPAFLF